MEASDFLIEVGDKVGEGYRVTVAGAGRTTDFVTAFEVGPDLRAKLGYLPMVLRSSAAASRAVTSIEEREVQFIGSRLFRQLTAEETLGMLSAARQEARDAGRTLRITLRIRPAELANLPWEFLFDHREGRQEYLSRQCLIVRNSENLAPIPPLRVVGPLRVLAMVSVPDGLPGLDVGRERSHLDEALAQLVEAGRMELRWIPGTKRDLLRALAHESWHVFHYIGHGDFDEADDQGRLAFSGPDGRPDFVTARQLAAALGAHPPMRLAVLNACQSSADSATDQGSGMAAALVRAGIAAVAAMQFPITDTAASVFSGAFYEALAAGQPVDQCTQAGRIAIIMANGSSLEWGTPVLHLRSASGSLFDPVSERFADGAHVTSSVPALYPSSGVRETVPDPSTAGITVYVTPLVRKLALDHGVDLSTIVGTGAGGRIRKQDVLEAAGVGGPADLAPVEEFTHAGTAPIMIAAADAEGPYVTPLVRKLALDHGVDLSTIVGTGAGGRIRKQDVLEAAGVGGPDDPAPVEKPAHSSTAPMMLTVAGDPEASKLAWWEPSRGGELEGSMRALRSAEAAVYEVDTAESREEVLNAIFAEAQSARRAALDLIAPNPDPDPSEAK